MATRDTIPASPLTFTSHAADLDDKFGALFDGASFPLTSVGGTANAVTATLVPALDGDGLQDGMCFTITWASDNTGNVTLAINGGSALAVNQADGTAIPAGGAASGLRSLLEYVGGAFRMLTAVGSDAASGRSHEIITASQSWTVPDLPDDTPVTVQAWGGGGGGHNVSGGGGGGGGGYSYAIFRLGDLGASVTCTIGAGGAAASNGGNTTFGSHLAAYGGQRGQGTSGGTGAGASESGNAGGYLGGGVGVVDPGVSGPSDATGQYGGGGGGFLFSGANEDGGRAVYGGGGGAGSGGSGGASKYAGAGGDDNVAGTAPSGGGGLTAAGARGQIIITI